MVERQEVEKSARFIGLHAALVVAIWLAATVVYTISFGATRQPLWIGIDAVLVVLLGWTVARQWPMDISRMRFLAIVAVATVCVVVPQWLIKDQNGVWLDESNYLETLRTGHLGRMAPFNMRWLAPFLAGRWNILPTSDADALKALNFGGLVVAASYLSLLIHRLRGDRRIVLAAPVFFVCSYLGAYAGTNRLVVDAVNYALFMLIAHALVRPAHARYVPLLLLVAAFNSEKVIYWIPVIAVLAYWRVPRWRHRVAQVAWQCAPMLVYLAAIALYLRGSSTEDIGPFPQQLYRMGFMWISPHIDDPVALATTPQMLWFPFGAFTVYALLGLRDADRLLKALALLLVPIMVQPLIAHDAERMTAYAFIVYLPLGCAFLTRVLAESTRVTAAILLAALVLLAFSQHYLIPLAVELRHHGVWIAKIVTHNERSLKLVLSAAELALAGSIVWLHAVRARGAEA